MARYELAGRFWSIVRTGRTGGTGRTGRAGATLTTTSGKIGSRGRTTTRSFATAGAADAQHDDLVLEKLRAGYRLVDQPAAVAGAPIADAAAAALEASIVADPSDTAAYAVYADWLQRQGDPRGELIALQLAREAELARKPTGRSTLQIAIGRHFEHHAATLLGPLAALVTDVRDLASGPFVWHFGFIHRVVLDSRRGADLGAIVEQVLGHPSGRFVRELAIRSDDLDEAHRVVDVLRALAPPTLSELDLVVRAEPLDLGALWPAVAQLRRIAVVARAFDLGAVCVPAAERARFATARLSSSTTRAIAAAPWPALQRLELRFGGQFQPSGASLDDLLPLLVRTDLPALTHLKLRGCGWAGEALTALASAPLARQLVVIDLSHGHVERDDLRALAHHTQSFPRLRELWLPSTILPDAQRALAGIAKLLISDARGALDTFPDDVATRPASR
jgi:uncharacterized protein (TIGR02996 family)